MGALLSKLRPLQEFEAIMGDWRIFDTGPFFARLRYIRTLGSVSPKIGDSFQDSNWVITAYLATQSMQVYEGGTYGMSSGIETASGLIDCLFLMIPIHESLKDSTEIVSYPYKQE